MATFVNKTLTFLAFCDQMAPWKCRVQAKDGRRPLTTKELSAKSGLSPATIKKLTRSDSWLPFEMSTIVKFTTACGVDLVHQKYAHQRLLRIMQSRRGPAHLNTSQRKYWNSVFTGERNWRAKS